MSQPAFTQRAPTRQTDDSRTGADATADQTRSDSRGVTAGPDRSGAVIEQARVAVAVLAAHRQLRELQRRADEQARGERLDRWHHDDAQRAAARAREEWGLAR